MVQGECVAIWWQVPHLVHMDVRLCALNCFTSFTFLLLITSVARLP